MADSAPVLLVERRDRVALLTLNRPTVLNAFNDELVTTITRTLRDLERDDEVGAVVITGAGRAFCAGQDLQSRKAIFERGDVPHLGEGLRERYKPMIMRIRTMEKPVIAALNGTAAGAGCGLALACDLGIAAVEANLVMAFTRVGLAADSGASYFLPRLVGLGRAMEIAFLGEPISAEQAERIGLVNRVYPAEEVLAKSLEMAERLATGATRAIGLIKRDLNRALDVDLETALDFEAYQQEIAGRTDDYREAITAFFEKRRPSFKGH
jgi:2-(1,2-epoxy-1,2-dihydrophenyl)acetyl-CoA isomerase